MRSSRGSPSLPDSLPRTPGVQRTSSVEPALTGLRAFLPERIELLALDMGVPVLQHVGALPDPDGLRAAVTAQRQRLAEPGRFNEEQAILSGSASERDGRIVLPYRHAEYAVISALREAGQAPFVLSASVLLVCHERREVFVQRRSAFCDAAAGLLHTVSGAQKHPIGDDPGVALLETARREVREETGLEIRGDDVPYALVAERLATSYQFVLLGAPISPAQVASMRTSVEGAIVAIPFDDLPLMLARPDDWAATGFFHVLLWLATRGRDAQFAGRSASDVLTAGLRAGRTTDWRTYY